MRERDIFIEALQIAPASRAAFIDEACRGNADLRERVQSLLNLQSEARSFLEPAPAATIVNGNVTERPGDTIGPYKLLEQIGEGGFGVVFMAEQTAPVKRKVALKVIKPGMDTREVIARFEAERQALALMDHPNIAKVFDAGATDTGRPFFVMELVRGIPITDYCDLHHLSPRERLELFVTVCHAVQHAHQKGIIHRDIKPTNVLVALHDPGAPGVVKVIDFGVAKATSGQLTDKTLFTGFAQVVGTPLYMSPEQAALSAIDIDTRSDIYSLGVLLYELLTGTTPFDKTRLQQAAFEEVRRIIREEEPQKPSTRLSSLGETLPSVSAVRKTEPRKLSQLVRGDLDWIVMKALEKDRARRYETANGFAGDVLRHLADEPVLACPPSASYRLRKFTSRHRVPLAVAAGFLLLLVASTLLSSYQALQLRDEQKNTLAQKDEADNQRWEAQRQRTAAQVNEAAARNNERLAEQRLAEALTATGDALLTSRDVLGARKAYDEAIRINEALSLSPLPAASGLSQSYVDSPAALLSMYTEKPIAAGGCAIAPDGRTVAVGAADATCWLFDLVTGMPTGQLIGHNQAFRSLAFSHDGSLLITTSLDGTARIWDVAARKELHVLRGHEDDYVYSAVFAPDARRAVTGGNDGTVRIWDVQTGECQQVLTASGSSSTWSVCISPDGRLIASGGQYGCVNFWDLHTGAPLLEVVGLFAQTDHIAFTPDGLGLLAADWSKTMTLLYVIVEQPKPGEAPSATTDETRPAPRYVANVRKRFGPVDGNIRRAQFIHGGRSIVTAGYDGTVRVWDTYSGNETDRIAVSDRLVFDLAVSSDDRLALTSDLRVWDLSGEIDQSFVGDINLRTCAVSPDGCCVVTGDADGTLKLRDRFTWRLLTSVPADAGYSYALCFLPDGRRVMSIGVDHTVRMWDTTSGALSHHLVAQLVSGDHPSPVAASPAGRLVAFRNGQNVIEIFDVDAWKAERTLSCREPMICAEFSADGRKLLTGHEGSPDTGYEVVLWDLESGKEIMSHKEHRHWVQCVALSSDGKTAVSGSWDQNLIVWNLNDGTIKHVLRGHTGHVISVAVSNDSRSCVSASQDGTLRLWDLQAGELVRSFSQGNSILGMALLKANATEAIAIDQTGLRVWRFDWARELRVQDERLRQAQQVLHARRDDAEALRNIGEWYTYRGRWDWGGELLERAEQNGARVSPLLLARCAWMTGRDDDAKRFFARVADSDEVQTGYVQMCIKAVESRDEQLEVLPLGVSQRLASLSERIESAPENLQLLMERSHVYLRRARFQQAAEDFANVIHIDPGNHRHWFMRGSLLAFLRRDTEYREHSREMTQRFSDDPDWYVQERTVKVALLLPSETLDQASVLAEHAKRLLLKAPDDVWFKLITGMAEYRAERFEAADFWLKQCRTCGIQPLVATADAFLAMALHRQGRLAEARSLQRACGHRMAQEYPMTGEVDLTNFSEDWVIAHVACRECEEVISGSREGIETPPTE